jgi:hypothetical protein
MGCHWNFDGAQAVIALVAKLAESSQGVVSVGCWAPARNSPGLLIMAPRPGPTKANRLPYST